MNLNQKLILGLSFGCVVLSTFVETNHKSNFNPSYSSVQSVVRLNGGAQNSSSGNTPKIAVPQTSPKAINKREILRKHFPDWEERMNYQKKQEKIYRSGLARMTEAKRVGMEKTFKLTKKEQDAFDYFNGKNFYKEYQSIETPPNIFDTRWSFLLKIEKNKDMRENFLKSYNRRKIEN
jgi:hypothetical protein